MGMPRNAVIGMMKDQERKISVKFVLGGNLNDPFLAERESGDASDRRLPILSASTLKTWPRALVGWAIDYGQGLGKTSIGKLFGK